MSALQQVNPNIPSNQKFGRTGANKARMSLGGLRLDMEGPIRPSAPNVVPPNRRQTMAGGGGGGIDNGLNGPSRRQTMQPTANRRQSSGRGPSVRKDNRPDPKDHEYQQDCKILVRDHLIRKGHPVTAKSLSNPTQQDFFKIFDWLWKEIDPNHKFGDKPEEQIPDLLQWLKCPTSIKKSQLKSVGSPHFWPQLLSMLRWLVELIEFTDTVAHEQDQIHDEEEKSARIFFDFLRKGYRSFLDGDDSYINHEDELRRSFNERNAEEIEQIRVLEEKNESLKREIAAMKSAPDRVEELDKKKDGLCCEIERLHSGLEQLKEYHHEVSLRLKKSHDQHELKEGNIEDLTKEKAELDDRISKQEISAVEVDRMNRKKKELEEDLESLEQRKEELEKVTFETEVAITRKLSELEKKVQELNTVSAHLNLVPSAAKYADGGDYEVRLNPHATQAKDLLSLDLKLSLLPKVHSLKERFNSKFYAYHQRRLELSTKLAQVEEVVADRTDDCNTLKKKISEEQAEHQQEKERWASKLADLEKEINSLIQETETINDQTQTALDRSNKQVELAKEQLSETQNTCYEQIKSQTDALIAICEISIEYKDHVSENLRILSEHVEKLQGSLD